MRNINNKYSDIDVMQMLLNWLVSTLAIIVATYLVPVVQVSGFWAAFVAALVLGVANAFLRPILIVLTLPINIMTLGLFTFVINAFLVMLTGAVVPGFDIPGFGWALLFSLVLALVNAGIHLLTRRESADVQLRVRR
jgi:putative membrane protein